MKRFLSVTLSAALLCGGLAVTGVSAEDAAKVRPTVTLVESGFENGMDAPFVINGETAADKATVTHITLGDTVNAYLHISERKTGQAATAQQNIADAVKANKADGKYYISARVKLDKAGDTAYADPYIQSSPIQIRAGGEKRFAVGDTWTDVGKDSDGSFMAFKELESGKALTAANLDKMGWCKFYFIMYQNATGSDLYDGSYSIDDVTIWFVPNEGAPEKVTAVGENILKDGTFDANMGTPDGYNNKFGGDSWYVATNDGSGAAKDRLCTLTVEKEGASATEDKIHGGTSSLYITNRPHRDRGIQVDMKAIATEVGPLAAGESYSMSVWVRAEDGEEFTVTPIFGSKDAGVGMILGGDPVRVTDEWTEVGIKADGTYSPFTVEGGKTIFDPSTSTGYASLWLRTSDTKSYYIDDFKVFGPQKPGDAVEGFVQGVNALPAPADITRAHGATIEGLEKAYEELAGLTLTDDQKAAVAAAKAKLAAARAAYDALPAPKNSFVPEYKYENKANLIDPYGNLESFTANDYVWNEENTEGDHPKYTLITDKNIAHGGNNCLLISDREKSQHAAAYTLTNVVKSQGGGKYYFSCWMRTKNPGEEMDVFPLLYVGGLGKEFYIDNDTRYKITNEWTYVGVTYDNLDGYFRSNGEEMPELDDKATYVALRFYGQNESLESAEDGVMFPDYYIDDLKFWKAFDGQENYKDPDNPTPTPTPPPRAWRQQLRRRRQQLHGQREQRQRLQPDDRSQPASGAAGAGRIGPGRRAADP